MKYSYVYNIIELYLKNENDVKKVEFNLTKYREKVVLELNMINDTKNKTAIEIPLTEINTYISDILKKYKNDLMTIDEKYQLNSHNKECFYRICFSNGRVLTLNNFSMLEINNLRNILFGIDSASGEMHLDLEDHKKMNYKPRLQPTGFASFKIIFLAVIVLTITIILSLWIFNDLIK